MAYPSESEQVDALARPLTLPCGQIVPNRLVKAPLQEMLCPPGGGDPTQEHFRLYEAWAKGGWGMVITGNVMVSRSHGQTPFDVVLPNEQSRTYHEAVAAYKNWAVATKGTSKSAPLAIMQLCHAGRQSMRGSGRSIFTPALCPSAVPLNGLGTGAIGRALSRVAWGTPKEMDDQDFEQVINEFVEGTKLARETGFNGVQIHCSHGYLLAQFLSPNINVRTDKFGGSAEKRTTFLLQVIDAVREVCPISSGFCVGVKLNCADYVDGGLTEADALQTVKWMAEHGGVDFIEISGGTYESPKMLGELEDIPQLTSSRTSIREAFFLSFASSARNLLDSLPSSSFSTPAPKIMLTGGFRTRNAMAGALISSSADLIGIGRPACADPFLPLTLLNPKVSASEARSPTYTIKGASVMRATGITLLLPGINGVFHTILMAQIGAGSAPQPNMNIITGAWRVWFAPVVRKKFPYVFWVSLLVAMIGAAAYKTGIL